MVSDNSIIANSFNNYFTNIGGSLAKTIKSDILHTNVNPINIHEITFHEVEHIISNMNNSADGYDELPSSIMKQCVETYVKQLTFLINMSITQGTFPNELKIARVIPLYNYNFFIHAYKYIACKMCTVLNMVHIYIYI